jgi:hypothetical protein
MPSSKRTAIYVVLDQKDFDFVNEDRKNTKMTLKGWVKAAINQMRKLRQAQKEAAND